jgi:hypothetical protein
VRCAAEKSSALRVTKGSIFVLLTYKPFICNRWECLGGNQLTLDA